MTTIIKKHQEEKPNIPKHSVGAESWQINKLVEIPRTLREKVTHLEKTICNMIERNWGQKMLTTNEERIAIHVACCFYLCNQLALPSSGFG